jgi:hypothetical protein
MPTLIIENMPEPLFDRIQRLAQLRRQAPAETAIEVLEGALWPPVTALPEARLPQEPLATEEICAPCTIPRPPGQLVTPVELADYVPRPHDVPREE